MRCDDGDDDGEWDEEWVELTELKHFISRSACDLFPFSGELPTFWVKVVGIFFSLLHTLSQAGWLPFLPIIAVFISKPVSHFRV